MTTTPNQASILDDLRDLFDMALEDRNTYAHIIADDMAKDGIVSEWYLARYRTCVLRHEAVRDCYFATSAVES